MATTLEQTAAIEFDKSSVAKTRQTELQNRTMLTDLYQLTMMAAYHDNKKDDVATFDLFIRGLPKGWGYYVAAGIEDAIDYLTNIKFAGEDIQYLREQGMFKEDFLQSLKDFKFEGDAYAVREGTPIFANEPIMRITAPRIQAQFVETALLNMINFQTMIATKTSRIVQAATPAGVIDFGLRRAQEEDAAMKGARAAYIAGAVGTSNVKAGKEYGIPIKGTHAHSFVMSFDTELEAFRAYAKTFPNNPTLLIDTYDTEQGARNAAIVGHELEAQGKKLGAVRLDSGDLADLSKKVRKILDEAGLLYVKVTASNDLNEYKITQLKKDGAQIDGYGVGTELITAKPVSAISGVYKLAEDNHGAKIKLSEGKTTLPGKKQVYRVYDSAGIMVRDIIALDTETICARSLLESVVQNGRRVSPERSLSEIQVYCKEEIQSLPDEITQVESTAQYPVLISDRLNTMTQTLTQQYGRQNFLP